MIKPIYFVSSSTLEPWDWSNPWTEGIGGSETAHIVLAQSLVSRGYNITSLSPLGREHDIDPLGMHWYDAATPGWIFKPEPAIVVNYRNPCLFDGTKPKGHKWYFVAQDVDAPWLQPNLEKVDRFFALCQTHAQFVLDKYPYMKGKVFITSNGVRTDYIEDLEASTPLVRDPNRLLYASSPDRGLHLLLQQWWRIKERFPEAQLRIAYGFNNVDKIVSMMGGNDWRADLKRELEALMHQDGITWLGRLPQRTLYEEWFQANIMPYPCDFPETSNINIMDAMACGAIPVTTKFWAQGEHAVKCDQAYVVDGLPQKSELVRSYWLEALFSAMQKYRLLEALDPAQHISERLPMMKWARRTYDWERIATQWEGFFKEDL